MIAHNALVLEGGGYRGCFTAGVLDVLMEHNVMPFSDIWGTSAGALNACNAKAHHIGRQIRVSLAFRDDKRMMSVYSFATTGSIVGNDFLFDEVQNKLDPFDYETFDKTPVQVWACATNLIFGTPQYFLIKNLPKDLDRIKASSALPLVTEALRIDNELFVDGGVADSVPVNVALGLQLDYIPLENAYQPADKAVVVLTRPRSYRKNPVNEIAFAPYEKRYASYPLFLDALKSRPERYNQQREEIFELEKQGRVLVIAPPVSLQLSVAETSGEKLLHAYILGRQEAMQAIPHIKKFLS